VTFLSSEHRMAASTAGEILKRHGLVRPRRRRRGVVRVERSPIIVPASGHTMTADYKGHFRLGNRHYCYPLTIADPASRYIFAIEALASTNGNRARPVFERVFREYGLPEQIVTDNGSPFCAPASLGAISELSKWWIRLGIRPVRIDRGKPQQNAIHERMHRTLKEWTTCPAQRTMPSQQCSFDEFRLEYNTVRPHQSLGQGRADRLASTLPKSLSESAARARIPGRYGGPSCPFQRRNPLVWRVHLFKWRARWRDHWPAALQRRYLRRVLWSCLYRSS
jgi:putative transposase